nr:MAG TPA: hypothetical protein [Caudoviricetes sp.]
MLIEYSAKLSLLFLFYPKKKYSLTGYVQAYVCL